MLCKLAHRGFQFFTRRSALLVEGLKSLVRRCDQCTCGRFICVARGCNGLHHLHNFCILRHLRQVVSVRAHVFGRILKLLRALRRRFNRIPVGRQSQLTHASIQFAGDADHVRQLHQLSIALARLLPHVQPQPRDSRHQGYGSAKAQRQFPCDRKTHVHTLPL